MNGKLSQDDVRKVARLARLSFSDAELASYGAHLNSILSYMDKLNELNTDGVEPTSHSVSMDTLFREDVPQPSLDREEGLKNAPERRAGYVKVPRILDEH